MGLKIGDRLPDGQFIVSGANGPEFLDASAVFSGKRVALFGLPGAFTPTCSASHLPSFVRVADQLRAKGIDEIACLSVNDIHVMRLWGEQSGAKDAGILMLADPTSAFTKAIDMAFTNPKVGMHDRCIRFSALVEDGEVKFVNLEDAPGVCNMTAGESFLEQL